MRKFNYEEVSSEFAMRGYKLLETEYIDSRTKMRFRCPKHPNDPQKVTLYNFKRGYGCACCSGRRNSIDVVRIEFMQNGMELLENQFINGTTKMKYRCLKSSHIDYTTYNSIKIGNGCKKCYNEAKSRLYSKENNPNWNGGITSLSKALRNSINSWKQEVLAKYDYRCAFTGERTNKLQIHHIQSFSTIRDGVLKELGFEKRERKDDYTEEEIQLIIDSIEEKHKEVLGVPLRKDIHKLFHHLYGRKDNTTDQLDEFKLRWDSGEFANMDNKKEKTQHIQLELSL